MIPSLKKILSTFILKFRLLLIPIIFNKESEIQNVKTTNTSVLLAEYFSLLSFDNSEEAKDIRDSGFSLSFEGRNYLAIRDRILSVAQEIDRRIPVKT